MELMAQSPLKVYSYRETATNELWIAEVKSGNIQKRQKNVLSAIVRLREMEGYKKYD